MLKPFEFLKEELGLFRIIVKVFMAWLIVIVIIIIITTIRTRLLKIGISVQP